MALDLWDVADVNPAKIHMTVPRAHRSQREAPTAYELHREDLDVGQVATIEGVPVVTPERSARARYLTTYRRSARAGDFDMVESAGS